MVENSTVSAVRDELVWIDCEMTGLDLTKDRLIEIAVLVTDADLNILGEGLDVVIHADDEALSSMVDVVKDMHARSGLTEEVRASTVDSGGRRGTGARLHPHPRQAGQDRSPGRQLDRHRPRLHRAGHAQARRLPALPDDRRQLHQRAVPALVSADLLRPAREGPGPPRAGRHPRVDPRTQVLPPDRLRRPAGTVDQ